MNINRYNYETFFLLYIDRELSEPERLEVEAFVAANPDLATELDLLQNTVIDMDALAPIDLTGLLKPETGDLHITLENYEAFFVRYVDDELNSLEKEAVEKFVYQHPALQVDFEWLKKCKLSPDQDLVFENKEILFRKEEEERKPVIAMWFRFAAAAMFILMAGIWWANQPTKQKAEPEMAVRSEKVNSDNSAIDQRDTEQDLSNSNNKAQDNIVLPTQGEEGSGEIKLVKNNITSVTSEQQARYTDRSNNKNIRISKLVNPDETQSPIVETPTLAAAKIEVKTPNTPALAIDKPMPLQGMEEEQERYTSLTTIQDEEDPLYVGSTSVSKKNNLRGVIRKASRMIEKNTSVGNGEGSRKEILIGNLSLSLR
jgi:hypothetical protein